MRALSESRFLRFATLAALYFAQGLPWGFVSVGYVVFLADQGLTDAQVGRALAFAFLPWSYKVLFGPLLDALPVSPLGRRRPYIVAAQLLMGLTLLSLLVPDPRTQLGLVAWLVFANNTFAALQDVATDGLAVDLLPERERASANSVMWAAKHGGILVGGTVGTLVAEHVAWTASFVGMTVLLWGVTLLLVAVRERPPGMAAPTDRHRFSVGALVRSFAFRAPIVGLLIAFAIPSGYGLTDTLFTKLMRSDLHHSAEVIALVSGTLQPLAAIAGALLGGVLAVRLGVRRTIGLAVAVIAAAMATFGVVPHLWPQVAVLAAYTVVLQLAIGAYGAASLGLFMTLSNPVVGATQFGVYTAATNLAYASTAMAGGWLAERIGQPGTFLVAAVVQVVAVLLVPLCDPLTAERRFRGGGPGDEPGAHARRDRLATRAAGR